jgi:putative PIN family toxin of toxin-antitoxin system
MRVLADTNIFISYLLSPRKDSFVTLLLEKIAEGKVTLLLPEALLSEIDKTIRRKPKLLEVITETVLESFLTLLQAISEEIPLITQEIPTVTRDPKDDYLIAYAVIGKADYLISVDKDLLVLGEVEGVKMVHSGEFRQVLK